MWASAKGCLRKVTSIILVTTALLWVLLNVPVRSDEDMAAAPAPLTGSVPLGDDRQG